MRRVHRVAFLICTTVLGSGMPAVAQVTTRVSVSSVGYEARNVQYANGMDVDMSADGRFVVFASNASTLVENDTNGLVDIFVHDRTTATTSRVSVAADGGDPSGYSSNPSISDDGRYVAFESTATNLVAGDPVAQGVFLYDRQTGTTVLASVSTLGVPGEGRGARISDNRASGIGSRFFTVNNSGVSSPTAVRTGEHSIAASNLPAWRGAVLVARGIDRATSWVWPDANGVRTIAIEPLERIEIRLNPWGFAGVCDRFSAATPLPIGSAVDPATGVFTWQPGPGFGGIHELTFVRSSCGRAEEEIRLRVTFGG